MILEEGTDEKMKQCIEDALLPPVGSRWVWRVGVDSKDSEYWFKVLRVDEDGVIHVQFNGSSLNFSYTLCYWLHDCKLQGWRQV